MTSTPAYCPVCGKPSPGGAIHSSHSATPATPTSPASSAAGDKSTAPAKNNRAGVGCLGFIVLVVLIAYVSGAGKGGTGGGTAGGNLTGNFVKWVPVDDAHGYAYFSITNTGSTAATAKCSISVKDDFGDFGFDSLVGESVDPGRTITGKMALSVGKGSFLINSGEVKDC